MELAEEKEIFYMKTILFILEGMFVLIDIGVFVYLYKLYKKHSCGDEAQLPTQRVLPYVIAMAVISFLIPTIGLCIRLM